MRNIVVALAAIIMTVGLSMSPGTVAAQTSAAEMLEQARARARDMEELKKVLNGLDQNMRLASFDVMVNSGDNAMREIAIDTGLASADALLQAMAFKEVVLSMDHIVMSLEIDVSQPETIQTKAQALLNSTGNMYTLQITDRDRKTGTINMGVHKGQVSGTKLSFKFGYDVGELTLIDETTMKGNVRLYKGGYGGFVATAKIR